MSADWWLHFKDEEDPPDERRFHLTYNLNPMLALAGWTWPEHKDDERSSLSIVTETAGQRVWSAAYLEGARAADIGEKAMHVLRNLEAEPEKYRALNPANGWGTYEGLVTEWRRFVEAIRAYPDSTIGTWF